MQRFVVKNTVHLFMALFGNKLGICRPLKVHEKKRTKYYSVAALGKCRQFIAFLRQTGGCGSVGTLFAKPRGWPKHLGLFKKGLNLGLELL